MRFCEGASVSGEHVGSSRFPSNYREEEAGLASKPKPAKPPPKKGKAEAPKPAVKSPADDDKLENGQPEVLSASGIVRGLCSGPN